MINATTGEVGAGLLQPLVVDPSLSRSVFHEITALEGWREVVINEPYASWNFPALEADGTKWAITLQFQGDRLIQVTLCDANERFGVTYHDFSWELERQRKDSHDRFIEDWIGASAEGNRSLPWGTIESVLDRKTGGAFIIIEFREHEHPQTNNGEQGAGDQLPARVESKAE